MPNMSKYPQPPDLPDRSKENDEWLIEQKREAKIRDDKRTETRQDGVPMGDVLGVDVLENKANRLKKEHITLFKKTCNLRDQMDLHDPYSTPWRAFKRHLSKSKKELQKKEKEMSEVDIEVKRLRSFQGKIPHGYIPIDHIPTKTLGIDNTKILNYVAVCELDFKEVLIDIDGEQKLVVCVSREDVPEIKRGLRRGLPGNGTFKTELVFERALTKQIKKAGHTVRPNGGLPSGQIADIIVDIGDKVFIIECKLKNQSHDVSSALGQLLCYREFMPEATAVAAFPDLPDDKYVKVFHKYGIQVITCFSDLVIQRRTDAR